MTTLRLVAPMIIVKYFRKNVFKNKLTRDCGGYLDRSVLGDKCMQRNILIIKYLMLPCFFDCKVFL